MKHKPRLVTRQQKLEFARPRVWFKLPPADQNSCRQLLAQLMQQHILRERKLPDEPRED